MCRHRVCGDMGVRSYRALVWIVETLHQLDYCRPVNQQDLLSALDTFLASACTHVSSIPLRVSLTCP